jgi:outer membrane protein assembly factor BamA
LNTTPRGWLSIVTLGLCLLWAGPALAQVDLAGRPISEVKISGLKRVEPTLVRNQVRSVKGTAYDPKTVEEDIRRITFLGRFKNVTVEVMPQTDGSLILTFALVEQSLMSDVRVIGNKQFSDAQILGYQGTQGWVPGMVVLRAGDGADEFLIEKGLQRIKSEYEKAGYFQADVVIDKESLKENLLIYRVREGPLVAVRDIKFEGNTSYTVGELDGQIKSETATLIFRKGHLNRETLDGDVARLRDFYRDRGYLEAEVGRRIDISPDERDAVVTFVISEGPLYTVASIVIRKWVVKDGRQTLSDDPLQFPREQVLERIKLKVGDVYGAQKVKATREGLSDLYGKLGHIDMRLRKQDGSEGIDRIFHEKEPKVDVIIGIVEARPHFVGPIEVRGNERTKDNVILREVRIYPGRPFDKAGIDLTQRRLKESPLFDAANVTVLGDADDPVRGVLIDVDENPRPGTLSFGAGISSDSGVLGAIDLIQRNFDIADWPNDFGEFITGKAFVGAGQLFALTLSPGDQFSTYSVRFREPYFLETPLFFDVRAAFTQREREDWDEGRAGGQVSFGKYFGDVWRAQLTPRIQSIDIENIDEGAPVDIFDVEGNNQLTALAFSIVRDTTNSRLFPTDGSVLELGFEQVGLFGGDFHFTRLTAEYRKFWKVDEDFFGRATVLSMRAEAGYIVQRDEAPTFERFYAGGHKNFRGFDYRGVGPRGIRNDSGEVGNDPVGGDFMFLLGFEYNWPIYQEVIRGVVFVDSGTVDENLSLSKYRLAIGAGIRIKVPFLGQAPFAFDLAVPLLKEEGDETRFFSFDIALPF